MEGGGWSIYDNREVRARYEIFERVGSGAFAEVYRGRSRETGALVALKEIHEQTSSVRELSALQALKGSPNVVQLVDFFWQSPGIILVLEYLRSSLADVLGDTEGKGLADDEVRKWMKMFLNGVAACHSKGILHRDLKPSNLLIGDDGVLRVADFGTSRFMDIRDSNVRLLTAALDSVISDTHGPNPKGTNPEGTKEKNEFFQEDQEGSQSKSDGKRPSESDGGISLGFRGVFAGKSLQTFNSRKSDIDIERWLDGGTTTDGSSSSRILDEPGMHTSNSYAKLEAEEDALSFGTEASPRISDDVDYVDGDGDSDGDGNISDWTVNDRSRIPIHDLDSEDNDGELTGCIGTRWYRAPEVLFGSTKYGYEMDLWGIGCIFGEMIQGEALFPGISDIDQLSRIVRVLGVPNPENWPGVDELPDYDKINFSDERPPVTVVRMVSKGSKKALELLVKFLVYRPESRVSAQEALKDVYFEGSTGLPPRPLKDKQAVDAWLSGN